MYSRSTYHRTMLGLSFFSVCGGFAFASCRCDDDCASKHHQYYKGADEDFHKIISFSRGEAGRLASVANQNASLYPRNGPKNSSAC